MLRTLRAKALIREMFSLKKDVKMMMRVLQENSQNVWFLIFQKTDEEKKNQNRGENKVYVSRDEGERNFNCDNFFACFNFEKHCNLNRKKHKTKSEQIIERASFQWIRSFSSRTKKQYELIREEKTLWKFLKKRNIDEKLKQFLRLDDV